MKLNKKRLKELREKRAELDAFYRRCSVVYRGYHINQALGFRYNAFEGRRGFLVPTGMQSVLASTLITEIQNLPEVKQ